ncbi:transmembrane protein 41A-like [Bacillus rossius redtenbacheri]|uniref:transmembrane protein 41A-like n=1 Tax=Bacillus rossius redtenbacheri TaxID=93214 RepID=UPI002FDD63A3
MQKIWCYIPVIVLATGWLYLLVRSAPSIGSEDKLEFGFPQNLEELRRVAELLRLYSKTNLLYVIVLFSSAYVYKQMFSIPGSAVLNLLGGALFGVKHGLPLCCTLTAAGASLCYWLSHMFGAELVQSYFSRQLQKLRVKIEENSHQLVYYMLFLRVFPMTPNWLINLVSPVLGIPYGTFVFTAFLGLMPFNYLCVQAGEMLASLSSLNDLYSYSTLFKMAAMACVALAPTFVMKGKTKTNLE